MLPTPRILNGRRATDRKLCRCAAKNESTLAQSFTMEPWHCHCAVCLTEPHIIMNISKPSLSKSNTGVRTLISQHKRRTLVTLKILFFVEQENAWDFHCAEWERETHRKCVSLTRDAWDLAGLKRFIVYTARRFSLLLPNTMDRYVRCSDAAFYRTSATRPKCYR